MYLWCLVIAQFALATLIVLSTQFLPVPWIALVCCLPGAGLAVAAWFNIGLRRIRIHPTSTSDTDLQTSGAYGLVRHPMYSGLLAFTAPLLFTPFQWWRVIAWALLVVTLDLKSRAEEVDLRERFTDYSVYAETTGRLTPKFRRD
ncbi:MAG: methyltransferase [Planctomycetota bacterium]